jgi:hypothetical protein
VAAVGYFHKVYKKEHRLHKAGEVSTLICETAFDVIHRSVCLPLPRKGQIEKRRKKKNETQNEEDRSDVSVFCNNLSDDCMRD